MIPFVVVAGGLGKRLGGCQPKQYLLIKGKPILYHTIEALVKAGVKECVLVLDPYYQEKAALFLEPLKATIEIKYAVNGTERQDSVQNGLALLPKDTKWVAIHDGVRPFVSKELIEQLLLKRDEGQCVIPVSPLKDTIKKIENERVVETLNREFLYGAGTPQIVDLVFYKKALQKMKNYQMADDASLVEASGGQVVTVINDEENIKITTPFDLIMGEAILRRQS